MLVLACALLAACLAFGESLSPVEVALEHTRHTDGGIFSSLHVDKLEGRFELEGTTYFITMHGYRSGSGFLTGLFASKESKARESSARVDTMSLSLEREPDWPVEGPLPRRLFLEGRLFDFDLDAPGGTLKLTPVQDPVVPVKLSVAPEQIVIATEKGNDVTTAFRPGQELLLTPGTYRLREYDLFRKGPGDTIWGLTAQTRFEGLTFEVKEEPVELEFGEPFATRIVISSNETRRARSGASQIRIEFAAEGKAGERVAFVASRNTKGITPWRRSNRPQPPKYKIVAPDGEVVAAGRFEYG